MSMEIPNTAVLTSDGHPRLHPAESHALALMNWRYPISRTFEILWNSAFPTSELKKMSSAESCWCGQRLYPCHILPRQGTPTISIR